MALSAAWAARVGAAAISIVMSGVMSGVMVALNGGLGPQFPMIWLKAWGVGLLVSFPTASVVVPPVVRWTARLHTDPDDDRPLPR